MKLTSEQQARVDFLLNECDCIETFAKSLSLVESSNEIHQFATHYNWDYGLEPLELALIHPLCDKGTALEIYALGSPDYYVGFSTVNDVPSCNQDGYLFLKFIESLLTENRFKHNHIHFDPLVNYSTAQLHYLAKYSKIPDELLLPNFGDPAINKERLRSLRDAPNDIESLDFLTNKYLKSHDYSRAMKCAENLLVLDSGLQRNWYIKISILKEIEKAYDFQNTKNQEDNIYLYQNSYQVRQNLIECYQNTIKLYQKDLKGIEYNEFTRRKNIKEQIIKEHKNIVNVHLRDKDCFKAIESLEELIEQAEIEPIIDVDVGFIALRIAKVCQELQNYDQALYWINIYLKDIPKYEYQYFHKLIILKLMGCSKETDQLLEKMLDTIDQTIEEKQCENKQEASYFFQKSKLLEEYRKDFQGAADSLQKIIDLKLYYNDEDRHREITSEIQALISKSQNQQ